MQKNNQILCKSCNKWVDCSKNNETQGFCLVLDLFTYTLKQTCTDYEKGKPMTEKEWEGK